MRKMLFSIAATLLLVSARNSSAQTVELQEQVNAVLALQRAGALVESDTTGATRVSLSGIKSADRLLGHVKVLTDLKSLELVGTNVSDNDLAKIKGLTRLESLNLASTKVGNKGVEHLRGLTNLTRISLLGTPITDAGLVQLKGQTKLQLVVVRSSSRRALGRLEKLVWRGRIS